MKDITCLIAHGDDELLFAWPVWNRISHLVCMSSDLGNLERPEHQQHGERKECLKEVGAALGCEVTCFDYGSEFYRLPTRDETLKNLYIRALVSIEGSQILFTHNSWGEYQHIDHVICNQIGRMSGLPMLVTDIAQEVNWGPVHPWKQGEFVSRHVLDRARFDSLKAIYDKRGCWTWSQEPVAECGVYRI